MERMFEISVVFLATTMLRTSAFLVLVGHTGAYRSEWGTLVPVLECCWDGWNDLLFDCMDALIWRGYFTCQLKGFKLSLSCRHMEKTRC